ncbi:MAG: tetratricopeptide repeat protein [Endomicrobium sp.]|jgi:predicted negative regulator of RcsB-dependent stress response|nr:tetratricopeptide repeat protein [Endomicrobium sp.]
MNFVAYKKLIIEIISKVIFSLGNKVRIFTVTALTIGLIFIGAFIYFKSNESNKMSSNKLSEAYTSFARGDIRSGFTLIDETIARFPKTTAAYQARLIKADILIEMQKHEEALRILEETLNNGKPKTIKPLASSRIIYVYDSKKNYPKAIFASNEFIKKYPDHFLIKDIYLNLAEYYLLSGSKNDAVRVFNEIVVKFSNTQEAKKAQSRLNNIK